MRVKVEKRSFEPASLLISTTLCAEVIEIDYRCNPRIVNIDATICALCKNQRDSGDVESGIVNLESYFAEAGFAAVPGFDLIFLRYASNSGFWSSRSSARIRLSLS